MGNLQTGEGKSSKKSKGKTKLDGKKKGKLEDNFTPVVPEKHETANNVPFSARSVPEKEIIIKDSDPPNNKLIDDTGQNLCATKKANDIYDQTKTTTPQSSSESYFTNPQTPVGIINNIVKPTNLDIDIQHNGTENFLHNLALNSFKLNEYRARHEEEKTKKLSKLGVSKTSQISLDSDPNECFVTDNVEIISQIHEDSGYMDSTLEKEDDSNTFATLADEQNEGSQVAKTISEVSLDNAIPEYKRNMSVPLDMPAPDEHAKLKKVASFTLSRTDLEARITKPKFVPEKLDFQLYEKFEGHMLVNWCLSEFNDKNEINKGISCHELKILIIQFCTHLLAAGVLKQLPDKDVAMYNIFKPDLIYFWTHTEAPVTVPQTPGRLSMISWPPMSPSETFENDLITTPSPMIEDILKPHQELRNSARDVEILSLEEEIKRLKQEIEKYKTLVEIQTLTKNAVIDFSSPVDSPSIEEKFSNKLTKETATSQTKITTHVSVQTDSIPSEEVVKPNTMSRSTSCDESLLAPLRTSSATTTAKQFCANLVRSSSNVKIFKSRPTKMYFNI